MYCYGGDYSLTGTFFDWTKVGDKWFTRFSWLDGTWRGFGLYTIVSAHSIQGTWWGTEDAHMRTPPQGARVSLQKNVKAIFPRWASDYFSTLAARRSCGQLDTR